MVGLSLPAPLVPPQASGFCAPTPLKPHEAASDLLAHSAMGFLASLMTGDLLIFLRILPPPSFPPSGIHLHFCLGPENLQVAHLCLPSSLPGSWGAGCLEDMSTHVLPSSPPGLPFGLGCLPQEIAPALPAPPYASMTCSFLHL